MKKIVIIILSLLVISGIAYLSFDYLSNNKSKTEEKKKDDTKEDDDKPKFVTVDDILNSMTLEEKIGQMFIVDLDNLKNGKALNTAPTNIDANQIANLKKFNIGGVIFFRNNLKDKNILVKYIKNLQSNSKHPLFVSVDEEGGTVSRLGKPGGYGVTYFPNMSEIGATGDVNKAYNVGKTLGSELKSLGFNVDFAPVADINTNPNNPVIGNRAFGNDSELVASMVVKEVEGMQSENVSSALKHFPGHGDTSTDTHTGLASITANKERLDKVELVPFKAGIAAGADFVLTAHISTPNVTGNNIPATMSKEILTDILRQELNFENIIITDALNMGAIANYYSTEEIVLNCVNAGVDIMLMPKEIEKAINYLLKLVNDGTISEERINDSVRRIVTIKQKRGLYE